MTCTVRLLGIELLMPSLTVSENFKSPVVGGAMKLAVESCPLVVGNEELAVERVTI